MNVTYRGVTYSVHSEIDVYALCAAFAKLEALRLAA